MVNTTTGAAQQRGKIDEYEFLSIGRKQKSAGVDKALERVKSMVRNPEARDQYMRLVAKFESYKVSLIKIPVHYTNVSNLITLLRRGSNKKSDKYSVIGL